MIIGLCGFAQSGKDTVADYLVEKHGFVKLKFATALRTCLERLDPLVVSDDFQHTRRLSSILDQLGWEEAKLRYQEIRRLLQVFGTEVGRETIDDNVWVKIVERRILSQPDTDFVISDMRFENEYEMIGRLGDGLHVRVSRPGVNAVNGHKSENDFSDREMVEIVNDGGFDDLYKQIDDLVESTEKATRRWP